MVDAARHDCRKAKLLSTRRIFEHSFLYLCRTVRRALPTSLRLLLVSGLMLPSDPVLEALEEGREGGGERGTILRMAPL